MRRILDAIFCVSRTGCPWRYLPIDYPPWQTVFYHLWQFRCKNTLYPLHAALRRTERVRVGRDPDPSAAIMESQSVKTVEESVRIRGYDAHKGVKGRKRHLLVDTLLPIAKFVTPADVHDTVGARKLLGSLVFFVPRLKTIWADATYRREKWRVLLWISMTYLPRNSCSTIQKRRAVFRSRKFGPFGSGSRQILLLVGSIQIRSRGW